MRGVQPRFFSVAVNTKLATDMFLQGTAKHTCADHCKRFVNCWQAMEQCSEVHSRSCAVKGPDFANNTAIHKGMILQLGACADAVHNMTWQAGQSALVQNNLLLHRLCCCLRVQLVQHRNTSQVPLLATGQGHPLLLLHLKALVRFSSHCHGCTLLFRAFCWQPTVGDPSRCLISSDARSLA